MVDNRLVGNVGWDRVELQYVVVVDDSRRGESRVAEAAVLHCISPAVVDSRARGWCVGGAGASGWGWGWVGIGRHNFARFQRLSKLSKVRHACQGRPRDK